MFIARARRLLAALTGAAPPATGTQYFEGVAFDGAFYSGGAF